jgi:hypothetical protein
LEHISFLDQCKTCYYQRISHYVTTLKLQAHALPLTTLSKFLTSRSLSLYCHPRNCRITAATYCPQSWPRSTPLPRPRLKSMPPPQPRPQSVPPPSCSSISWSLSRRHRRPRPRLPLSALSPLSSTPTSLSIKPYHVCDCFYEICDYL